MIERPAEDQIAVEGCTPRIVDEELWRRIQDTLNDLERTRHQRTVRSYHLRGRLKCGACGSAMVGQTLTSNHKPYKYYRCRHIYDNNTGHAGSEKYVRGDRLEGGVWSEVRRSWRTWESVRNALCACAAWEISARYWSKGK